MLEIVGSAPCLSTTTRLILEVRVDVNLQSMKTTGEVSSIFWPQSKKPFGIKVGLISHHWPPWVDIVFLPPEKPYHLHQRFTAFFFFFSLLQIPPPRCSGGFISVRANISFCADECGCAHTRCVCTVCVYVHSPLCFLSPYICSDKCNVPQPENMPWKPPRCLATSAAKCLHTRTEKIASGVWFQSKTAQTKTSFNEALYRNSFMSRFFFFFFSKGQSTWCPTNTEQKTVPNIFFFFFKLLSY